MSHDEIRRIFPNASRSLLDANRPELREQEGRTRQEEGLPAADRAELERCAATPAVRKKGKKEANRRRFLVRVTSVRKRLIDEDNLCEKYAVDCCRYAGLLPGDGPGETKIEVAQRKAGEAEGEHTVIEIFELSTQPTH